MNGANAMSRRRAIGYLGAALATSVSAKWAISWSAAAEGELLEIPMSACVGAVPDGALVAVLLEPGPVGMTGISAYLCNGAEFDEWFTADIAGDAFSLTSDRGTILAGTIGPAGITGTVRFPAGSAQSFELHPATGAEGLYYLARSADGRVFGASAGGVGVSFAENGERVEGAFVLPEGILEPIELPAESVALDDRSADSNEAGTTARFRAIVAGSGTSLRIAGAMVAPRPSRKCVVVKRVVVLSDGSQQAAFVTVCSR